MRISVMLLAIGCMSSTDSAEPPVWTQPTVTVSSSPETMPLPSSMVPTPAPTNGGLTVTWMPLPDAPACSGAGTLFSDVTVCSRLMAEHRRIFGGATWLSTGTSVADIDRDGWPDVFVSSQDGANHLFFGSPDGRFEERTPLSVVGVEAGPANFADVNADGYPDLFVAGKSGPGGLFLNRGGILQPSQASGPESTGMGHGISFSDFDADGRLELYISEWRCETCYGGPVDAVSSSMDELWVQTPNGWEERGQDYFAEHLLSGYGFASSWGDWDNDGDPDLYVANDKGAVGPDDVSTNLGRNVFLRNDGPGCSGVCFTEVALENGSDFRIDSMGLASGDIDNDGDMDFAMTHTGRPVLARNDGAGGYTDIALSAGILDSFVGWGAVFLDYDNDGLLDLYMASSTQNLLWHNDDGQTFTKVGESAGLAVAGITLSAVSSDYDRDGRVDLFVGDFGSSYRVMRNTTSNDHHWIGLLLKGRGAGGTDALGARVTIVDSFGRTQIREVKAGSSHGGGEDLGLHFGFGAASPVSITVRWPDGGVDTLSPFEDAWVTVRR